MEVEVCKAELDFDGVKAIEECERPFVRVKAFNRTLFTYYGVPQVNELLPFLEALEAVKEGRARLEDDELEIAKRVKGEAKLFVTPTCPYCPNYADLLYNVAIANENFYLEVYDVTVYEEMIEKYLVRSTPKLVFNGKVVPTLSRIMALKAMAQMSKA